jgi:predicted nucleotidyltransferase
LAERAPRRAQRGYTRSVLPDAADLLRDERLARLLDAVVHRQRPVAVYLFGSRAEGGATEDSDYDLMVVLPDDAPDAILDPVRAQEVAVDVGVPADIVPVSLCTFNEFRGALYSLPGYVHACGRLLYAASP